MKDGMKVVAAFILIFSDVPLYPQLVKDERKVQKVP